MSKNQRCPKKGQTDFTWHLPKTLAFELDFTGKAGTRQVKERGGKSLQIKRIAFAKSKRNEENFKCRLPAGGSDGVGWQGQEMRQEGKAETKLQKAVNVRLGSEEPSHIQS